MNSMGSATFWGTVPAIRFQHPREWTCTVHVKPWYPYDDEDYYEDDQWAWNWPVWPPEGCTCSKGAEWVEHPELGIEVVIVPNLAFLSMILKDIYLPAIRSELNEPLLYSLTK